jgi:methylated-DNA-protein-cysteine methyltransferase-like protein
MPDRTVPRTCSKILTALTKLAPKQPTFRQQVEIIVTQIPAGKVMTYGQVACCVGYGTARLVGMVLSSLPNDSFVHWQRVVNAKGGISPRANLQSSLEQIQRLRNEGIQFNERQELDLNSYRFEP